MRPLMDINIASPPRVARTADGLRDVEEWGLKVQKMANVHSITLAFVRSSIFLSGSPCLSHHRRLMCVWLMIVRISWWEP
jgi:hypothetical protein